MRAEIPLRGALRRRRFPWRHGVALLLAATLAACASGGAADTAGTAGSTAPRSSDAAPDAFDGAALAVDTATQLERVGLVGIDTADVEGLYAAFDVGDGERWATRVLVDDAGPYVFAPLHPSDPAIGGDIVLALTDGERNGPPMPLTVTPLPGAPGAFDDTIDAVRSEFDGLAVALGTSWDDVIATDPADASAHLAPLKMAQLALDDVAAAFAELDAGDQELLDAVFGRLDLAAATDPTESDALLAAVAPPSEPPVPEPEPTATSEPQGVRSRVPMPSASLLQSRPTQSGCIASGIQIGERDPGTLSALMTNSAIAAIATDPNGVAGKRLAALELVLGVGATIPSGAGKAFGLGGVLAGVWSMAMGMAAGINPSVFTSLNANVSSTVLPEDREDPDYWDDVRVTAASTGYSFDRDAINLLINAFTSVAFAKIGAEAPELEQFYRSATADVVNRTAGDLIPESGMIRSCPESWTVVITGEAWSWVRPMRGLFDVDNSAREYQNTTEVGADVLRFAPIPERFGQRSITHDIVVETMAISVVASPTVINVTEPGDTVPVTATIQFAEVTSLAWTAEAGSWDDGIGVDTNDGGTRPLKTPTSPSEYPFRVTIESTSRQGLRADGEPARWDFVEVRLVPIIITPNPGTVRVNRTLPFAATDRDGNPVEVIWSAGGGTVDHGPAAATVYLAGEEPGTYEVTAQLASNPDVSATAVVNVVEAECLVGTWRIVPEHFAALLRQEGITVTPTGGSWTLTVDEDHNFVSELNGFAFSMNMEGMNVEVVVNGAQRGRVHLTETHITGVETFEHNIEVTALTPIGPIATGGASEVGIDIGGGPYHCDRDTFVVNRDGYDFVHERIS